MPSTESGAASKVPLPFERSRASSLFRPLLANESQGKPSIICAEGSANQWQHLDLTQEAASHGPKPVAGSPLAAYRGGGERVVYIGADGNIHQILQGPKWTDENLTQAASAPSPAA